jgi:hypothetical protein
MFTNLIASLIMTSALTNANIIMNNNSEQSTIIKNDNMFKTSSRSLLLNSFNLIFADIFTCTKSSYGKIREMNIDTKYGILITNTPAYTNFGFPHEGDPITNYIPYNTTNCIYWSENNKIAEWFWKQNLWTVGYLAASVINYSAVSYLDSLDSTGISGYCYILAINISEMWAISTWKNSQYIPENLYIEAPIFSMTF